MKKLIKDLWKKIRSKPPEVLWLTISFIITVVVVNVLTIIGHVKIPIWAEQLSYQQFSFRIHFLVWVFGAAMIQSAIILIVSLIYTDRKTSSDKEEERE